ncbi:MAG: histidine kinase [Gemmatimonadaceae bacterium]
MTNTRPSSRTLRTGAAVLLAWTVFGAVHAITWMATDAEGWSRWRILVPIALIMGWGWALLSPLIYRLTRAVHPSRVGWIASLSAHAVAAALVNVGMTAFRIRLITWFTHMAFASVDSFSQRVVFWSDVHLFAYVAIVVMSLAVMSFRRYLDRSLRAHVLETQLARAQLHYLELQLQPHFLFNSLNAIQELAHEAPHAAERMLHKLRSLLALSVAHGGRDEVSLADELTSLQWYVDIQRTRFSEWLTVSVEADEVARRALVPHLILQPLVENSIRHGLSVRSGPGTVQILARRLGERLHLEVRDNGVGLAASSRQAPSGIGLKNAGDRLRQLYGADQSLLLADAPGGGTIVEINIPYREAPLPVTTSATDAASIVVDSLEIGDTTEWRTGEFSTAQFTTLPLGAGLDATASPAPEPPVAAPTPSRAEPAVETPNSRMTIRLWSGLVALWLAMGVVWTLQMWAYYVLMGRPYEPRLFTLQLVGSGYWIALAPLTFYLARKVRVRPEHWIGAVGFHLLVAIALSFGHLALTNLFGLSSVPILDRFNLNPLTGNLFIYFGLVAWVNARDFRVWYRAREVSAARLTAEIATSRFRALCVQLRPQFLLGTLELLAQLVHSDVWRAEHLIARLADVLRRTLDSARDRTTTLRQEMQLLTACVEAHRAGIRPNVALEVDIDATALSASIPSRLVCTMADDLLAGEAVDSGEPLTITVAAERVMDATRIRIHGDGHWRESTGERHAWWRKKSVAEAAIADAGPLVSVTFPDRSTAVVIVADPPAGQQTGASP